MKKLIFTAVLILTGLVIYSQPDCEGQRTAIHELNPIQRIALNDLILEYVQSQINPDYDPNGTFPNNLIQMKYDIVAEHTDYGQGGTEWHNFDEYFFEWHRDYIAGLEQFILDKEDCPLCPDFVPLPYWDITRPLSTEFWNQMVPEFDGAFLFDAVSIDPIHDGTASFKSDAMRTWGDYVVTSDDCGEYEDIDDFASFIQGWHGQVHNEMGGAMRSTSATAGTSVFWLYHAFVDEKYYCYQQLCQCPEADINSSQGLCDYCFDFSESLNTDAISVELIDANGNQVQVSLDENNCIPLDGLPYNSTYTVDVQAVNSSMTDNIACENAFQSFNFIVPTPPFRKFPCFGVDVTQSSTRFTVDNTGDSRYFNISNVETNTGATQTVSNSLFIASGQSAEIQLQNSFATANNHLVISSNGESISVNYVQN
ncbi:MAG: hypothetical protein ACJATI_005483 [Halioglobus sp.]|jgi:hypothetical protein